MSTSTGLATFVFDGDYGNIEQVRPFYDAYLSIDAELVAANRHSHYSAFKGRIPALIGPDEDHAIYLLQTMRRREVIEAKAEALIARGARWITEEDRAHTQRLYGTVVHVGFQMGGTGWRVYRSARLVTCGGTVVVMPALGHKFGDCLAGAGRVLFLPAHQKRRALGSHDTASPEWGTM